MEGAFIAGRLFLGELAGRAKKFGAWSRQVIPTISLTMKSGRARAMLVRTNPIIDLARNMQNAFRLLENHLSLMEKMHIGHEAAQSDQSARHPTDQGHIEFKRIAEDSQPPAITYIFQEGA